ncbi:MAG: ATP-binding protein [Cytophagales bacterium]|nr:ATP-binding protein [Bernardetiaceae bacterium]MDW8211043.1 ATP-binding protein [Cytophagales bacterium]
MKLHHLDELQQLVQRGESVTLEFKQTISHPEKIAKTLVAFANTMGGKVVVGISDKKEVIGIDPEEEKFVLQIAASRYCHPPIELTYVEAEIEEKMVLIVEVRASTVPHFYTSNGVGEQQFFVRCNNQNRLVIKS